MNNLLNQLESVDWFGNCGKEIGENPNMVYASNWKDAVKISGQVSWENTQLNARNAMTKYLSEMHKTEFQQWNNISKIVKTKYLPVILSKIEKYAQEQQLKLEFIHSVRWDLHSAFMERFYEPLGHGCNFYANLLEIYKAGHFPCGWDGDWPKGKLVIF
ncbi:hypothetical protein [Paenibacillus eucommiae]|uniref:Uncharacterized protein n=1 Tax=Paenibacillus eucommiae TaxID=1355755 RepID=A0ABS4J388_9BACL|nr:hypothetical protein [Paenibacillus eucommiae]MBP1994273.1 hypothetical protein [Paenibacillus eucommiae]